MISYKTWKLVNESFGGPYTLGLATPQAVGVVGSNTEPLEEKKKMLDLGDVEKKPLPPKKPVEDELDEIPTDAPEEEGEEEEDLEAKADEEGDHEEPDGDEDEEGKEPQDKELDLKDAPPFAKCSGKAKCGKSKMTKEESDWWTSVNSMLDTTNLNQRFESGLSEDLLIALQNDPNQQLQQQEIEPGQPGFAPQTRIGS